VPNHLIIGLGGTGGKIIRAFRKNLFLEFRKVAPKGVNIGYLHVDSSQEAMAPDDPSWKILGTSVQLHQKSQLLLQEGDLASHLDNLDSHPGTRPWIGSLHQWVETLGGNVGEGLGGQNRRLGRLLFTCRAAEFRSQVQSVVKYLQSGGNATVTLHVCFGLAGGIGSGAVVDVAAQLRDMFPDSRRYNILLYALLPETMAQPDWDTGNYHANGYAALLELNALSTGKYHPVDISGQQSRLSGDDPFNGCYLLSNENENGLVVDVNRDVPNIVADFLRQKIVTAGDIAWPTLGRMENAENGPGTAERPPNVSGADHSRRFLAFGIKRLAIPEEEIFEYLTYNFARQAALQLRFNSWKAGGGFLDEPRTQNYRVFVGQRENLLRWLLSDEHIVLSHGILPQDAANKKWKPINADWQEVIPNFKSLVRQSEPITWLDEISRLCEKRFESDYRGVGVPAFYQTKLKAKKEQAREIRLRVEGELFPEWQNGVKSAHDASRMTTALIEATDGRLKNLDDRIRQTTENEVEALRRVQANSHEWAQMGPLRKLIGQRDQVFERQAQALCDLYVLRTRLRGLGFAKELLQEVLAELNGLKSEVDRCASTLAEAVHTYDQRIAERVKDAGSGPDLREALVRFYDPQHVKTVLRGLLRDEDEQRAQSSRVRKAIFTKLGERSSFALFSERMGHAEVIDLLDEQSAQNARMAHNNLIRNPKDKLLGRNIVDQLCERYGANEQELRTFLTDLMNASGAYLRFNQREISQAASGGTTGAQPPASAVTVIIPRAPVHGEFANQLKAIFRAARTPPVEIFESDLKPNEIVILNLTNLFPLRYVTQISFLKQQYDRRIEGAHPARAKLELHSEGDGSQFPSLFPPRADFRDDTLPFLLLAKCVGILWQAQDPYTGSLDWMLVMKDADGYTTDFVRLGGRFAHLVEELDQTRCDMVSGYVKQILSQPENRRDARRDELQKALLAEVESILAERGNNLQDPLYRRFLDAAKRATGFLRSARAQPQKLLHFPGMSNAG
jgi:hypothetical protein